MPKTHHFSEQPIQEECSNNSKALSFISSGIACYSFSLLDSMGIIDQFHNEGKFLIKRIAAYPNPAVLRAAFLEMRRSGIIYDDRHYYYFTYFGYALLKHRASIGYVYNGYRHVLANQCKIAKDEPSQNFDLIDSLSVSQAAVHFGNNIINDMIAKEIAESNCRGTICDLGCGMATRLIYLCRYLGVGGYGFDLSKQSLREARKNIEIKDKISLQLKNIAKIDKIYPDVQVILQSFVMHDLPDNLYSETLESFKVCFPNLKLFVYIDAVSTASVTSSELPGFEYVHSLLNIELRDKKKTKRLISSSGFKIKKECEVLDHPNCFMWLLIPSERKKNGRIK